MARTKKTEGWLERAALDKQRKQAAILRYEAGAMKAIRKGWAGVASEPKPRKHTAIIEAHDFGLSNDDKVWKDLVRCDGSFRSIGKVALAQLEQLSDIVIEQGGVLEEKAIYGMEHTKASLVYSNDNYVARVLDNYTQIDKNGAYPSWLATTKVPNKYLSTDIAPKVEHIEVYEYQLGEFSFEYKGFEEPLHTHYYSAELIGQGFVQKWVGLSQNPKYKKLAKAVLNSAIGAVHRYRNNLMARYIWWLQRTHMEEMVTKIEKAGNIIIKCHTDSIGFIGNKPIGVDIGISLGQWKVEHQDTSIYMITAGQYQVKGHKPKISGCDYGTHIEYKDKEPLDPLTFPVLKVGKQIKCYIEGEPQYYTLGSQIKIGDYIHG